METSDIGEETLPFTERPTGGSGGADEASSSGKGMAETWIGPYRLVEEVGSGGFGVVWRAEQFLPLRRTVALKLLRAGFGVGTAEVMARFEVEKQTLARMEHPNIAWVLDAGTTADGRPYFVMEFVAGESLTRYCDERRLGLRERMDLFGKVCGAVQHAHQKGIIHRDLKPSNVLVTEDDQGRPVPKVIDFGIAKALSGDGVQAEDNEMKLETLGVLGTPIYMSPEQALGMGDIDTRSDVYSMGVILYELLAGVPPLDPKELMRRAIDEILRAIKEEEPRKPSTRVSGLEAETGSRVAAARGMAPGRLPVALRGDLDWIVLKALSKERERRYGTAAELCDDVRRYLDGEAVEAAPPGMRYRVAKFVKRHRVPVAAAGVVAVALLGGVAGTSWQWRSAVWERKRAERQTSLAESARNAAEKLVNDSLFELNRALLPLGRLDLLDRVSSGVEKYYQELPAELRTTDVLRRESVMWTRRGEVLRAEGRLDEALGAFHRSVSLLEGIPSDGPGHGIVLEDLCVAKRQLGETLLLGGKVSEAIDAMKESVTFGHQAVAESPDSHPEALLAAALAAWGDAIEAGGDIQGAVAQRAEAAAFFRRFAEGNPDQSDAWRDLTVTLFRLARSQRRMGDLHAAMASISEQRRISEHEGSLDPDHSLWQREICAGMAEEGAIRFRMGETDRAAELIHRSLPLFEELARRSPLDERLANDLCQAQATLGDAHVAGGDHLAAEHAYQQAWDGIVALLTRRPNNLEFLASAANIAILLGGIWGDRGELQEAIELLQEAVKILDAAIHRGAGDHMEVRLNLARAWQFIAQLSLAGGHHDSARLAADNAVRINAEPAAPGIREWAMTQSEVLASRAELHETLGNHESSRADLEQASTILRRFEPEAMDADLGRASAEMLQKIGEFHLAKGETEPGIRHFREAVDLSRRAAELDSANPARAQTLARALLREADAVMLAGDSGHGSHLIEESLTILNRLVGNHPERLDFACDRSVVLERQIEIYSSRGKTGEALATAKRMIVEYEEILRRDPANTIRRSKFCGVLWSLAKTYENAGDLPRALVTCDRAHDVASTLANEKPRVPQFRRDLAVAHGELAHLLEKSGRRMEALQHLEETIQILESLRKEGAAVSLPDLHKDTAIAWGTKGGLETDSGDLAGAETSLASALQCRLAAARTAPSNSSRARSVAVAWDHLAAAQKRLKKLADAEKSTRSAIEILEGLEGQRILSGQDLKWLEELRARLRP